MKYELVQTDDTDKHIYFTIDTDSEGHASQLFYEANLNRNFKISHQFNGLYRIAKSRWPKLQSYVRGVNKLQRFRF